MVTITTRPDCMQRIARSGVLCAFAAVVIAAGSFVDLSPAQAQSRQIVSFPKRQKAETKGKSSINPAKLKDSKEQMLVRADEVSYDYTNERVSAVGNVQVYYTESTLEADRLIYDQKTKRLHAEGNVRLKEADGKIVFAEILDLSDDFRDGFVDSLRLEGPDQTRLAASRADRSSGNLTIFQNGVYTACEPCKDDPRKPPKWQVKAARIIHDQGEKTMYFEDARLEFFGVPIAWLPYFSAPDQSEKRKSGFLTPAFTHGTVFGYAVSTPYYWALAPNYDLTVTPMVTSKQGPLLQAEWRHRLLDGAYSIRATGIFQLDKQALLSAGDLPGNRDFRGSVESRGQFRITDKWVYGWDGTLVSDRAYFQDYGLHRTLQNGTLLGTTPDNIVSQAYVEGRGERSFFNARAMYFYGFSSADSQKQLPIIHPIIDHDYTANRPVFGGELSVRSNLTSLSREDAYYQPINPTAAAGDFCALTADPALKIKSLGNCILSGVPGVYSRLSTEATWRRTIVDSFGQVFTPFVSARADFANTDIKPDPAVATYLPTGNGDVIRLMPTVGLEYRYPFISVQSWGTQTITPIAQLIARPNETGIGKLPNEDSQSLNFDASNLFRVNKYAGWDRVEGGGRLNAGLQYTAQFNGGGFVNALFGQSYHLFGLNSYTMGGTTNTGIASGLDTNRSDYVARTTYQPNSTLAFTTRFRFGESDFTLKRSEYEIAANFDRWTTTLTYGNYAAQPEIGLLDRREGVLANARYKVDSNWVLLGGVRYDVRAQQLASTQIGVGYVDDCLILAANYITEYAYNSNTTFNKTIMLQLSLRTLGGTSINTGTAALGQSLGTLTK
jgi:LPS-assembly protein